MKHLQVGDIVKVKTYNHRPDGWHDDMVKYMGRIVTITKIDEEGDIEIDADNNEWIWYPDEFELEILPEELFEI